MCKIDVGECIQEMDARCVGVLKLFKILDSGQFHPPPPQVNGGLSVRMQLNIRAYELIIPLLFFPRPTSTILFASHLPSSFLSSARLCSSPHLISPHFISIHLTSTHLTSSHLTSSCLASLRFRFPSPTILFSSFLFFPL